MRVRWLPTAAFPVAHESPGFSAERWSRSGTAAVVIESPMAAIVSGQAGNGDGSVTGSDEQAAATGLRPLGPWPLRQ